ncbi:MAG: AAA family ATPase [Blautia sp.]|nr:AAA family ATPase [Blautia sp.]
MGIYLNPGNQQFIKDLNSPIYIDKTEMISCLNSILNTQRMYVSVSRPRRFGKSMAVNMLSAYYGRGADSRELFKDRKLNRHDGWDKYLAAFDVIRLTLTDFIKSYSSMESSLERMQRLIARDIKKAYEKVDYYDLNDIVQTMGDVYADTGRQFVILIDEWDAVFRERKEDKDGQKLYLDFLRSWLKDKPYVALAYMTGILPIKKYGKHSALNMFDEYSMTLPMQLARFTGFTEEEVRELCLEYGRDYDKIKEWYDGYLVSDIIPPDPGYDRQKRLDQPPAQQRYHLYSPLSVVQAVSTGLIRNYWNKTESYEALAEYIRMDYDGLKETVAVLMNGARVKTNLDHFQNDMTSFENRDDVLALLVHLGYLGYDDQTEEIFIPNREILDEFKTSTGTSEWQPVFESFRDSLKLLEATWQQDEKLVAEYLEQAHDKAANMTYNSEAALNYAIRYAYYAAQKYYTILPELDTGKGYADVTFLPSPGFPDHPALVVELKYEQGAQTGLDQIRNRNYPDRLAHYEGNILLVAISYEKGASGNKPGFKHHTCRIQKV